MKKPYNLKTPLPKKQGLKLSFAQALAFVHRDLKPHFQKNKD